ncbi:Hypothetical_protein [Hexamita inflata]|uniref:Hypothetical_protein n=1 Tax=Hexamita inflata TaxID=28002 RepID=A0ABP1HDR3_9EUKA
MAGTSDLTVSDLLISTVLVTISGTLSVDIDLVVQTADPYKYFYQKYLLITLSDLNLVTGSLGFEQSTQMFLNLSVLIRRVDLAKHSAQGTFMFQVIKNYNYNYYPQTQFIVYSFVKSD